jgi:hypothetical protein
MTQLLMAVVNIDEHLAVWHLATVKLIVDVHHFNSG